VRRLEHDFFRLGGLRRKPRSQRGILRLNRSVRWRGGRYLIPSGGEAIDAVTAVIVGSDRDACVDDSPASVVKADQRGANDGAFDRFSV